MMLIHITAIKAEAVTLSKRVIGFATTLFPARMFCTIGIVIAINAKASSHNNPNNTARSVTLRPLKAKSRIAKGSAITKLITAAVLTFKRTLGILGSCIGALPLRTSLRNLRTTYCLPWQRVTHADHRELQSGCNDRIAQGP